MNKDRVDRFLSIMSVGVGSMLMSGSDGDVAWVILGFCLVVLGATRIAEHWR